MGKKYKDGIFTQRGDVREYREHRSRWSSARRLGSDAAAKSTAPQAQHLVREELEEARYWFQRAAAKGNEEATDALAHLDARV
jgi:TPR repeat protein